MNRSSLALTFAPLALASVLVAAPSFADDQDKSEQVTTVEMHKVTKEGRGEHIGDVTVLQNDHGLIFKPALEGLSPGMHGFHIHENPSCEPSKDNGKVTPGGAAGSHYDPETAEQHGMPWGQGHKGDLPALYVDKNGVAEKPVLSPRLTKDDLQGRSLMIHANGDNYSDDPKPLGGGGARVACGVFESSED